MMRPSVDSRSWVLVLVVVQVLVLAPFATGYNLDLEHSLDFNGPSSSMFGYSVVFHTKGANKWLIVGAPEANSSSKPLVHSPGALYRCQIKAENRNCYPIEADVRECGKTCEAESDHQWLGVSLSRQPGPTGERILACAHRWKNVYHAHRDGHNNKLPHGVCFIYGSDLMFPRVLIPCYRDHQRKFGVDYASCQAGMSSFQTKDLIIIGAPGTSYWTGSVMVFSMSGGTSAVYLDESEAVGFGSYLGYSVGAGQFLGPDSVEAVGGAPQANQKGKVFIFSVVRDTLQIISVVSGTELGSYFGSSVCAVDLNADGLSDLLVGAPMTTGGVREEGRVHVYINQGEAKLVEAEFQLSGRDAYAARFGESIADLGDLDDDGYPDVAIGAPHEDDLKGAVYIYNGREDGISPTPSQRITGSTLGRDLRMFGQSLSSGIDVDNNGYWDVAVGAFLSDSAVVLRTRPVIQVEASLVLPEKIDQKVALCRQHRTPTLCFNVTICFSVWSRSFSGDVDLQYNLTSDLLHKPSFPNRFYFHGNGSSNSTRGRVRARLGQVTCATHVAYQKKDVTDIFTPVQFEVSYSHRETSTHRSSSRHFPPLKPILHQSSRDKKTITNQTHFHRSCSQVNCSTNMQLRAELLLPHQQNFITVGSGETILLKTSILNSGDDALLPRMTLQFPENIHFVKVLHDEDHSISCAVTQEENSTSVGVDCGVTNLLPSGSPRMNISFLLDVSQNSTAGDHFIHINTSSDNYEREEYLQDNSLSLLLPLKHLVNLNIRGSVTPTSFLFGDEDLTPVDCYPERFNYTYKVLNSGPSRSVDTVVEITLPKILTPYKHRLLKLFSWQSSLGVCSLSNSTVSVDEDCEVPEASYIKQIVFFFSATSHRRMFCGRGDDLCERLVCRLGNLEAGREASIQLEVKLNPAVLLQAPGRHGIMKLESTAWLSHPREGPYTILVEQQAAAATVLVEALFTQKPSTAVKVFIIVISLVLGLMILAALIWCLWKAGFFKRNNQKEEEEFKRDSWDYVPKNDKRESTS